MAKLLIGICIVAFTTFCGHQLARKYRERKNFFLDFERFNDAFLNEISYYKRPIEIFLSDRKFSSSFRDWLIEYTNGLKAEERAPVFIEFSFLKEEEKAFINEYFSMLGRGDSLSQKGYFSSVKGRIEGIKQKSVDENKRYGDLYLKLGFLFGLALLILIV